MAAYQKEIIEVEVVEFLAGGAVAWRARHGQPHRGCDRLAAAGLTVGDLLVAEVVQVPARGTWALTRVLRPELPVAPVRPRPSARRTRPPGRARGGTVQPGDIVLVRVRFSSDDGSGRASKRRPCVVMEVGDGEVRVRPIHGTNGFVRREGMGRRLVDWKAANLRKPSVVSALDLWIPTPSDRPLGRLSPNDRRRLIATA